MMNKILLLCLLLCLPAWGNDNIYRHTLEVPMSRAYSAVYESLENNRFYVVFEPDIGKNLSAFAERWGPDYNRNKLDSIRSMVFCNGWYANQVGNADPGMLALCPLHITLTEKAGRTTILFIRPSQIAIGSAAEAVALEIENSVIAAIESASSSLHK